MADRPTEGGKVNPDRYENPEVALGGADAVEKTTYVTGTGTEPEALKRPGAPVARVSAGGIGATGAIIIFLLVAAVLVYLMGFAR
jgi:hypothetical protein